MFTKWKAEMCLEKCLIPKHSFYSEKKEMNPRPKFSLFCAICLNKSYQQS